jgi:single-strand DNA-binding protein
MKTVNKITLVGYLASDVNLMATKKGKSRAVFPLATNRKVKNDLGDLKEHTDYHRIVFFGSLADVSKQILHKGTAVYVEGKLVNNSYKTKEGVLNFRTEVWGDELNILSSKNKV